MLTKMQERDGGVFITNSKNFTGVTLNEDVVKQCISFAYDMSFGVSGEHRAYRSGGTHSRKKGEIFANTFQGKLSEFAVYDMLKKDFNDITPVDVSTYELGKWDDTDLILNNKNISIKSTKSFGNLLLLETKDWSATGEYIPNIEKNKALYDYFILVRIDPSCEKKLTSQRLLYSNTAELKKLEDLILSDSWKYDCPGFITHAHLLYAIQNKHIIKQKAMLQGNTEMDAENYYIQAGDFIDIGELPKMISK